MIPFLLGIIGLVWHYMRDKKDFFVVFLLFLLTGVAIVVYLNQYPYQPRERDYAYAGSFYAFCIWIGFGVMAVYEFMKKRMSPKMAALAGFIICVSAPAIMGAQGWDDHNRSNRYTARDMGINYLESCPPNAILFSFGDNDTYPLWYAQEVEGIRKDIRVVNYSLLGIDWYINELRYKVNNSSPIDVIWSAEQIEGGKRDYIRFYDRPGVSDQNRYVEIGRAHV